MKRAAAITILLLICMAASWASVSDVRVASMGNTDVAYGKLCNNPAFLYFRSDETGIYANATMSEHLGDHSYPYSPGLCIQGALFAGNISLELKSEFTYLRTAEDADSKTFDIGNTIELGVSAAIGIGNFAAGITVEGGSVRRGEGVETKDGRVLVDLFERSVISTLDRVDGSEFINLKAGIGGKVGNFSFGVVFDDVTDSDGESKWAITLKSLVSHIDAGFSFTTGEYGRRGRLNDVCFTFAAQVNDIFSDNTMFATGTEVTWQILSEYTASLRVGYEGSFVDTDGATVSCGLGFRIGWFNLAANVSSSIDALKGSSPMDIHCTLAAGYYK